MHADRCVEVEDGSYIYIDPALRLSWSQLGALCTHDRRLRVLRRDQRGVMSLGDAQALVDDGLAWQVGGRLFEQPSLMDNVFRWDFDGELSFLCDRLGHLAASGRGIEFGCGSGRLLLPLVEAGWILDGVDASEPAVLWLRDRVDTLAGPSTGESTIVLADIAGWAAPRRYDYAFAALNTLRYLPTVPALRRHMHLAALTVRPQGRYLVHVATWSDDSAPEEAGASQQWQVGAGSPDGFIDVEWSKVRHDPALQVDLECVSLRRQGRDILSEHQLQIALSEWRWREVFEGLGEWRVVEALADAHPAPVPLESPFCGNVWWVLERTGRTAAPMFGR